MKMKYQSFIKFFVLSVILIFSLAACSSDSETSVQQETNTEEEQTENENGVDQKIVTHAMGNTEVPDNPERIVVLDNGALDNLLAMEVEPVGAASIFLDEPFMSYLEVQTEEIENVGTVDEPNLESIAAANPDIILGNKDLHEKIYDKLSEIAPTVLTEALGLDWKEDLQIQAEAIGKTEEGEDLIADYEKRVEEFKAEMGDELETTELSILRPRADHVRIYLSESYSGQFIEELGFPRPAAQQEETFGKEVTEEQIADLDGDVIFWFERDPENIINTKLKEDPLWATLEAVQADKVYEVSPDTWLSGMGIQSRNLMLDDVNQYLVK
ncbi:ABC transporter substrate-binding protein [Salipaludibacillus sp. HK11]|uniref:ABC transporter substrate-binding protein n=1 Tax=Salipaludibacillus sp. HK11 TaxID=3394320 RepID=UPI0039FDA589